MLEVVGSWWHLTLRAILYIEWHDLETSFSVWRSIFRICRSRSRVKVTAAASQKLPKISGLDHNICYDNAQSNSELLTFWPWPWSVFPYFTNSSSMFWMPYASSFVVKCEATCLEYRSPSNFKVIELISRLWLQNSDSTHVCALFRHSLILSLYSMLTVVLVFVLTIKLSLVNFCFSFSRPDVSLCLFIVYIIILCSILHRLQKMDPYDFLA